jgi:transcriptional regulator with XRE-family HTH domain
MSTINPATKAAAQRAASSRQTATATPTRSITHEPDSGAPRLCPLGKRIEMLRVDRGVSKQLLARAAGTSRQQLWRVMTGKSELTTTLCQRLASVLDVDSRTLSSAALDGSHQSRVAFTFVPAHAPVEPSLADTLVAYLASSPPLIRTLRSLPGGDDGIVLKRALLNAVEDRARTARIQIPAWLFRVRASVLDGSL